MKKPVFAALLTLLYCVGGAAQNTNEWHTPKGLPSGNEIGVRYSAQLFMGDGRGPEFEAISIDYARYNYYNIGFRTGLNLFFDDEVCDYYSIPMQFTWRTERIRGLVFPGDGEAGSWVSAALLSIIPKQFEAHTGFSPGMMLGPLSREPYSGNSSSSTVSAVPMTSGCGLSSPSGGSTSTAISPTIVT